VQRSCEKERTNWPQLPLNRLDAATRTVILFLISHTPLFQKRKLRPPRTFKEAKIADEMARKACGLDKNDSGSQALLIHINELDAPLPIEASVFEGELLPEAAVPVVARSRVRVIKLA
jgi:hypothetical protein